MVIKTTPSPAPALPSAPPAFVPAAVVAPPLPEDRVAPLSSPIMAVPRRPVSSPSLAPPVERRRPMQGFLDRTGVAPAAADSVALQSQVVDRRQASRLQHMTQINAVGEGESECTAATLAVGTFELLYAQPTTVARRLDALVTELSSVRDRVIAMSPDHAAAIQDAIADLERLKTILPNKWTYGDVEELQNAFYVGLFGEEALRGNLSGSVDHDLTRRYRDGIWGSDRPVVAGAAADVAWLSDGEKGHCGLVANRHALDQAALVNVLFDPWPQSDGTSFNRGSDGPRTWVDPSRPAMARTEGRMLGTDVDDLPR